MELKGLITKLQDIQESVINDLDVVIVTNDTGCWETANVSLECATLGYDEDAGRVLLMAQEPIYQKPKQSMWKWYNTYNRGKHMNWVCPICNGTVDLDDKFCKHCGTGFSSEIKKGIDY